MKNELKGSSADSNHHRTRKKLLDVKFAAEIPDLKSDDEIAPWYQTHSTVLIQDQLETLPAIVGGKFRVCLAARRGTGKSKADRRSAMYEHRRHARYAGSTATPGCVIGSTTTGCAFETTQTKVPVLRATRS
jgi:hypothetical protein